ncbi:flavin reductase [Roseovarius salis]|uniref:flavin reductase n=1 Tax=Roseovarius salis TaxID=3376063 RepID=UPI0037C7902E
MSSAGAIKTEDKQALRHAFGAFATGVTVVTTADEKGTPFGFTANSFTSVSLDPPLLLICLAKSSSKINIFSNAKSFAVNILSSQQAEVSHRFATSMKERFATVDWSLGGKGAPLIEGVAAWFDCTPHQIVDAGDHIIIIGRVDAFAHTEQEPLVYLRGQYLEAPTSLGALVSDHTEGSLRIGALLGLNDCVLLEMSNGNWSLPMGEREPGFRAARSSLEQHLSRAGARAQWNVLYSVFDDPEDKGTWMFFQGTLETDGELSEVLRLFPAGEIPYEKIAARGVRAMIRRYFEELRNGSFGLYADSTRHSGHVARFAGEPMPWDLALNGKDSI